MADRKQTVARLKTVLGRSLEAHHLFPLFALLMTVCIWAVTYHLIEFERTSKERVIADSIAEQAETYEAQMIRNLKVIEQSLKTIQYVYEINGKKLSISQLKEKGLLPPSLVFSVAIADKNGEVIASTHPGRIKNVVDGYVFRHHRDFDAQESIVNLGGAGSSGDKLHFSRRINASDGSFAGIVMILVEPHYFTSGYERSRLGEKGVLGLIGENGVFLVRRSGDLVSTGEAGDGVDADHVGTRLYINAWDGLQRYMQTRRLYSFPLTLIVGLSRAEQMESFERQKCAYLWGAGAATLLLAVMAGVLTRLSWQLALSRRRTRKDQETFYAASEATLDAIFVLRSLLDERKEIVDFVIDNVNERGAVMLGRARSELLQQRLRDLLPSHVVDFMIEKFAEVARTGKVFEREWENQFPHIRAKWLYHQVLKVEDGVVAIMRDISERKQAEERISHMAHHDALTGLPNRTLLDDRIRQAISLAQRYDRSLTIIFIDLDDFKLVNDSLGHKVGDELLKIIADRMLQCVRQSDTVVRLGGDEFVIVLSDQSGTAETITPSLQRIRDAIAEPIFLSGQRLEVTASIGLATYPRDGSSGDALLMNADAAMYQAKALGRNNYQFFTAEMNQKIQERLALQDGLRNALSRDEFFLVYQPQIDLRSDRIVGVEALIRWLHPVMGLIAPMDFIRLAEENGMIVQIGEWVLRSACTQCKAWQDAGLPPMVMSVNVSARQFKDNNLIDQVRTALRETGLDAQWLELELTESVIMQNPQHAVSVMRDLRALGVRLSIDDFGSGYSSLSALKSFPIARLKLDRSFVRDLPESEDDRAIALTVVSLGHTLNLKVLAEGIETTGQLEFLKEHGCDEGQGYFFCMPLLPEEIGKYFSDRQTGNLRFALTG